LPISVAFFDAGKRRSVRNPVYAPPAVFTA
jgi:hypothetical protein